MKQLVGRLLNHSKNKRGSATLMLIAIMPVYWLVFFKFFMAGYFSMQLYILATSSSIIMSMMKQGWGVLNLS